MSAEPTSQNGTEVLTTKISRNWLIKMGVFMVALIGFGTWGLVDATVIYPRKGLEDASFKLKSYLQAASAANRLTPASLKIEDPVKELRDLQARNASPGKGSGLNDLEKTKLAWLLALDRAWKLGAAENPVGNAIRPKLGAGGTEVYQGVGGTIDAQKETHRVLFKTREGSGVSITPDGKRTVVTADQVLKDLTAYWTAQKKTPSALEFYDLPSQWVFVAIGYGGALYIVFLIAKVSAKKYRYEPATKTLILPGGARIEPGNLKELDKRRWHKFFVTLLTSDGKSYTLDLLRYVPLEAWVLEMEKRAFPEAAQAADAARDAAEAGTHSAASAISKSTGSISSMTYGGVPDGSFAVLLFDAASRSQNEDFGAYAQGEALKGLAAALQRAGGWSLWLTVGAGMIGGSNARVGGGPSAGMRTLAEWLDGKGFGYTIDASRVDSATQAAIRAGSNGSPSGGGAGTANLYAVAFGRLAADAAMKLHDVMMDPVARGYAGIIVVKSNPATIERITEPLEIDGGLEIKGDRCIGAWKASAAEMEQAGLAPADAVNAE